MRKVTKLALVVLRCLSGQRRGLMVGLVDLSDLSNLNDSMKLKSMVLCSVNPCSIIWWGT